MKKINLKILYFTFVLFTLLVLHRWLEYESIRFENLAKAFDYLISRIQNISYISDSSNTIRCGPTKKQLYVQLDSQVYPKYLSLRENKSINTNVLTIQLNLK